MRAIDLLLEMLDQAYNQKGWHGTTLRGALRGLTPKDALWRPAPRRHNIWELTLHAAYWKYAVRRRLAGSAI
ncbi:MAG TPA: DinB family protein, partial [Gemmatimonadales bacterium]